MDMACVWAKAVRLWGELPEFNDVISGAKYFLSMCFDVVLGAGDQLLIVACTIALIPVLNKILTVLTFGDELKFAGVLVGAPELSSQQISILRNRLDRINREEDGWYRTDLASVDRLLAGRQINLVDVRRIMYAAEKSSYWQSSSRFGSEEDQVLFDALAVKVLDLARELGAKMDFIRIHREIVDEMDIVGAQLSTAKWAAVASVASAFAAIAMACIAYVGR